MPFWAMWTHIRSRNRPVRGHTRRFFQQTFVKRTSCPLGRPDSAPCSSSRRDASGGVKTSLGFYRFHWNPVSSPIEPSPSKGEPQDGSFPPDEDRLLLSSQFWPMPSMSRGVIKCAKQFLSHPFSRIKSVDQWAVDREPVMTSTTSAKIRKTAIHHAIYLHAWARLDVSGGGPRFWHASVPTDALQ